MILELLVDHVKDTMANDFFSSKYSKSLKQTIDTGYRKYSFFPIIIFKYFCLQSWGWFQNFGECGSSNPRDHPGCLYSKLPCKAGTLKTSSENVYRKHANVTYSNAGLIKRIIFNVFTVQAWYWGLKFYLSVPPFVRQTSALWREERTYCRYFDTLYTCVFIYDFNNGWGTPPKISAQSDAPFQKYSPSTHFRLQCLWLIEKVQLTLTLTKSFSTSLRQSA